MSLEIENILIDFQTHLNKVSTKHELLHTLKPQFLGKNSQIAILFKSLHDKSLDEKKIIAAKLNEVKHSIERLLEEKLQKFEEIELTQAINAEQLDGTLPVNSSFNGSIHQLTKGLYDAIKILNKYGFKFADGPEIEEDFFNFQALNIPMFHPARQMQDTFYLNEVDQNNNHFLLRTHTTCVDIRAILTQNLQPPIALTSCGKVFRVDSDRTHSPVFHQIEAIMINEEVNMSHLKFLLKQFLSEFFERDDIELRFRPSFFPFTEPSAEADIGYHMVGSKIEIGGKSNFLEICGAGMIHPNVLKALNIDSSRYTAIAFGMGLERILMLKYGINDLRQFTASNLAWMEHYNFKPFDL